MPRAVLARPIRVTTAIDLEQTPSDHDHGLRNAWVAAASAVVVGMLYATQAWLFDRHTPHLSRDLIVFTLTALVLTPLIVAVHLSLHELTTELLRKLRDDHVIDPTTTVAARGDGRPMDVNAFAANLQHALNRAAVRMPMAALAIVYFAYTVGDAWATERSKLTSPTTALLIVTTIAAQAALVYLATVSVLRMRIASRAIGGLLKQSPVHIQPLHPDGCGGLWVVGHMFCRLLLVASIFGGAGLCIFLALHGTPVVPNRRPEPYLLGTLYAYLLVSTFLNLLWLPHRLLRRRREEILKPLANAFDAAIVVAGPPRADRGDPPRTHADDLAEIIMQSKLLDEACPVWPLHVRHLRPILVTAVLPVAIPIVSALISKFFIG